MDKNVIKSIIKNHDSKRLCELDKDSFDEFMITFVYEYLHETAIEKLNDVQRLILACTIVEDACQTDTILTPTENEDHFFLLPTAKTGFHTIGADKTAEALGEFIALMPEGTFENKTIPADEWFFGNEDRKKEISRIDSLICNYPDGELRPFYRNYICSNEENAKALLSGIEEAAVKRTGAESLKIALGSLAVFILIAVGYCVARFGFGFEFLALFNFPRTWISAVAVGAMCPLFLSLFFFGRYCKECGKSKFAYELLNSISAILLAASLLHMLLSLMGILG